VEVLLAAGADRQRIDKYETPFKMAQRAGLTEIAKRLARL